MMETLKLPFAEPLRAEPEMTGKTPVIAFPAQPAAVRNRAISLHENTGRILYAWGRTFSGVVLMFGGGDS